MENNHSEEFLLVCAECKKPFFTKGERTFYESNSLYIPKRCKECREARKKQNIRGSSRSIYNADIQAIYNEIIDNWSVEAKKEKSEYFYNVEEVSVLESGKKSFVIGRKGSGKTAIAKHLCDVKNANVFSQKLSFKNFPFRILYSLANQRDYTAPNQYISIWKYVIYSYICKKFIENNNIDMHIKEKLIKLYGNSSSFDSLNKLIEKWTSSGFGAEVFGVGFNYQREKIENNLSWIDSLEILERVILENCDSSKYIIVFDELDEDYQSTSELVNYKSMLTSLFKAVQDIRSIFENKYILPIVFLRSDIFAQLMDSDKNKWHESIIDLEWDSTRIQQMLAHRLNVVFDTEDKFEDVWYKLFKNEKVNMGNRGRKEIEIYAYIQRSTEMRPRDFIRYIRDCVEVANSLKESPITPQIVKRADDSFSEYLKGETIDELYPVIPEIAEILGIISTIRKQSFTKDIFEKEYQMLLTAGKVNNNDIKSILLTLFDAGVIGNSVSMKGQTIFKFNKKTARFNFNETMIVHRGLYKALQIY